MANKTAAVLLILTAVLITACNGNSSALKDGYYTVEAAEFDEQGWKEYLSICVSGGRIILVEYDAYNSSGFAKSWDMDYMREMSAAKGTYPSAYTRHYTSKFLEAQGTEGIDALTGATRSYSNFLSLTDAVLKNAGEGNSKTSLVHFGPGEPP